MNDFANDKEFLNALEQQSAEAFDRLYESYYRPLCYFAERLIHCSDTAQDIVTDSFVKLLQKKFSLEEGGGIRSLLYTMVRNACCDHLRSTRRHEASYAEIRYLDKATAEHAELHLIRAEVLQAIYLAIEQLPQKYRGIVQRSLLEGKKNEEIAEELHIAAQTVRNRKSEGLRLLRGSLRQYRHIYPVISIFYLSTML